MLALHNNSAEPHLLSEQVASRRKLQKLKNIRSKRKKKSPRTPKQAAVLEWRSCRGGHFILLYGLTLPNGIDLSSTRCAAARSGRRVNGRVDNDGNFAACLFA